MINNINNVAYKKEDSMKKKCKRCPKDIRPDNKQALDMAIHMALAGMFSVVVVLFVVFSVLGLL